MSAVDVMKYPAREIEASNHASVATLTACKAVAE